jgi:prevent-host-death family protein
MRCVGAFEAKTHLPRLLNEVEQGATITITRHGRPVAKLIPADTPSAEDRHAAIEAMRSFHKEYQFTLGGLSVREMIDEGRA